MSTLVVVVTLVAGGLAALARYGIAIRFASTRFPWAVLIVNVAGSLLAGAAIAIADALGSSELRLILLGGVAGGLTTFSTFSVETVQLLIDRRHLAVAVSVGANLFGGMAAVIVGWVAAFGLIGPVLG